MVKSTVSGYISNMGKIFKFISGLFIGAHVVTGNIAFAKPIYDIEVDAITGEKISLSKYKGQVVLIVNTASRCGFTPQYKSLEELYTKYKERGFIVLGFPSNDFLNQDPGSNEEIKKFCEMNYSITFPLFAKNPVTGDQKQPLFKLLTEEVPEELQGGVKWNFEKFLIGRDGTLKARFGSFTTPMSMKLTEKLEELLNEK